MRLSTQIYTAILAAVLVGGLFFLADYKTAELIDSHTATLALLDELEDGDQHLNQELLKAGFHLYYDYDAIQLALGSTHSALARLEAVPALRDEAYALARTDIEAYRLALQERDRLAQRFGTLNSLIKNSTIQIPTLTNRYIQSFARVNADYLAVLSRINSAVSRAHASMDKDFLVDMQADIDQLRQWRFDDREKQQINRVFLSHAKLFLRYLPAYAETLTQLLDPAPSRLLNSIRDEFLLVSGRRAADVKLLTLMLGGAFILTIILVALLLIKLDRDHGQLRVLHKRLKSAATTDQPTGLENRFAFDRAIAKDGRRDLCMLNVDNFNQISEFFGFGAGDFVLNQLGGHLSQELSGFPSAAIYRLGASEIGILLKAEGQELSRLMAHLIESAQERRFDFQGNQLSVELSGGFSTEPPLLEKADMALRRAMTSRERFVEYSADLNIEQQIQDNLQFVNVLRNAIDAGRVQAWFQPLRQNASDKISRYECLMRLFNEQGEVLLPERFLPVAKQTRLYADLTRLMIDKAIAMFQDKACEFSINLSIEDIMDARVLAYLFDSLDRHPGVGDRLILEILESEEVENFEAVRDFVAEARTRGCKIAIDDFGAGYSNFHYLMQLDVDELKIDASLIQNIDQDANAAELVAGIVQLCRRLGIDQVVAEYVHSASVDEKVRALGVDFSQGFHVGEPAPVLLGSGTGSG